MLYNEHIEQQLRRKYKMFKKIVVSLVIAAMLIASVPSEARGGFGGGGGRSSSSFSSARSSSSFSAPAPRASAPSVPVSRPTGGMSNGGNVGMQRPAVTNAARAPAPTYNPASSGSSYRPAYRPTYSSGYGNHQSYSSHTTVVHHYSPSTGGGGFGMGSLAMAAMGGYMLNGIMHEHSGAVYNGAGYTNGVPTQGGQYYTQPQVGDVQQQVQQPQSQQQAQAQAQEQMQQQPQIVYQQVPVESGMPTWVKILLWMFGITVIIALIRRIFI